MSKPEEASAVLVDRLIREAVDTERQRCIEDVCPYCRAGIPAHKDPSGYWLAHSTDAGGAMCPASRIHERIAREDP